MESFIGKDSELMVKAIGEDKGRVFGLFNVLLLALFITACFFFGGLYTTVWTLNAIAFVLFVYRFLCFVFGIKDEPDQGAVEIDGDLPKYCIMLPLKDEPPALTKILFESIARLDYPTECLDVVILIDGNDKYRSHYESLDLPSHYRLLIAEECHPMTKPKVCNLALFTTDAKYCVIYDAEDKPDSDQLLKVIHQFNKTGASVVQCQLHYLNRDETTVTRLFNLEYLLHWRFLIWGQKRMQGKGAVIPLGGTSNHACVETLKELGGWDAFNVTEDCEVGIRLSRLKKDIVLSESVTREFAVDNVRQWIKQRTRWQMGFLVTYFHHSNDVLRMIKEMGIWKFINFFCLTLGSVLNPLIALPLFVIYFSFYVFGFFSEAAQFSGLFIFGCITLIGNFLLITASTIYASFKYDEGRYMKYGLISYFYMLLSIISAYRSVWKLCTDYSTWEKTER